MPDDRLELQVRMTEDELSRAIERLTKMETDRDELRQKLRQIVYQLECDAANLELSEFSLLEAEREQTELMLRRLEGHISDFIAQVDQQRARHEKEMERALAEREYGLRLTALKAFELQLAEHRSLWKELNQQIGREELEFGVYLRELENARQRLEQVRQN